MNVTLPKIGAPQPELTVLGLPMRDGTMEFECVRGLLASAGLWTGYLDIQGVSHPQAARNRIANAFLSTPYQWLVFIDADVGFTRGDFARLMEGDDYAVTVPYPYKSATPELVRTGLGFTRLHRCVFEAIIAAGYAAPYVDRLPGDAKGHDAWDLFPSGAVPSRQWFPEDLGFWSLCELVGVSPRVETRPRLTHTGKQVYTYV